MMNIESIINDMKLEHQRIRSSFKFSMSQIAKNPNHFRSFPSENKEDSCEFENLKKNSMSFNPNFYEKDEPFSKLQIQQN